MKIFRFLKALNEKSHYSLSALGILTVVCFHFFIFYTYNPLGILTFGNAVVDKLFEVIVNIFVSLLLFLAYMLIYYFMRALSYWYFSVLIPAFKHTELKSSVGDKK